MLKSAPRVSFPVQKKCENCRYYKALTKSCKIYMKPIEKARELGLCEPQARMFVQSHVVTTMDE